MTSYATNHISSDFGHVSNSSRSAVAAALLCSWRCTGHLRTHGGDSSRFLSGCPDSPSCCMHAFYTRSRIFRNFLACLVFPKLVFCSAKDRLMGVCAVGAQATTNACSSCSKPPCITIQTFRAVILCNNSYLQRFWACFKQ